MPVWGVVVDSALEASFDEAQDQISSDPKYSKDPEAPSELDASTKLHAPSECATDLEVVPVSMFSALD